MNGRTRKVIGRKKRSRDFGDGSGNGFVFEDEQIFSSSDTSFANVKTDLGREDSCVVEDRAGIEVVDFDEGRIGVMEAAMKVE